MPSPHIEKRRPVLWQLRAPLGRQDSARCMFLCTIALYIHCNRSFALARIYLIVIIVFPERWSSPIGFIFPVSISRKVLAPRDVSFYCAVIMFIFLFSAALETRCFRAMRALNLPPSGDQQQQIISLFAERPVTRWLAAAASPFPHESCQRCLLG